MNVNGVDVLVDGQGAHTVLMLHGWPDTPSLWDSSVAALQDGYRCVRVFLPGYDLSQPPQPVSVVDFTRFLRQVVDAVSPQEPVSLLLHDWGCLFGYEFAARHSHRVARIVGVDIGDTSSGAYLKSLSVKEKLMIAYYQLWLAAAWKLGRWAPGIANRMTRFMARAIGCRNAPEQIAWQMNYPYAMGWFGTMGGLRELARVDHVLGVTLPALYIYGRRKPFMFHSARWLDQLAATPGCEVKGMDTGHWVMRQKPVEFNACVRTWLDHSTSAVR
ncbi:MAG: alpha/beta fold hydrolase [Hydrogenophaga sp.]|uniref:alpha/beta fold hydrolase n=1 Tax=Hydrogenophaga sp. TaxID=1904254 RepID=UPI003D14798F